MTQLQLFDRSPSPYTGQRVAAAEIDRLGDQNAAILARLRRGPASNRELAAIALKYTGRISELREHLRPEGWTVCCIRKDRATGESWYALARLPEGTR